MAYSGITTGVVGSDAILSSNMISDTEKVMQVLKPYQTPILQWLWFSKRKPKEVNNAYGKFTWYENELYPHQAAVRIPLGTTGTPASIILNLSNTDNTAIFNLDDIVLIEDNDEPAYVSGKGANTVTLSHIDGVTGLQPVGTVGSFIKIIGSKNSEFSGVRTPAITKDVEKSNYLTIFSESITTTGRQQAGKYNTDGLTHDELVEKKIEEMKLQIERYFLFAPQQGYATTGNYRTTWGHGLLGRIMTNVADYSGVLAEPDFDLYLKDVFQRGSNRKLHLCGSNHLADLNRFLKEKYELNPNPDVKIYGVNLKEYITPFGVVDVVWDPVMDGKFSNYGFTIDSDKVTLRYMADDKKGARKFRIEEGVETPGVDGTTTKILFDLGIEIHNEECHGMIRRV